MCPYITRCAGLGLHVPSSCLLRGPHNNVCDVVDPRDEALSDLLSLVLGSAPRRLDIVFAFFFILCRLYAFLFLMHCASK